MLRNNIKYLAIFSFTVVGFSFLYSSPYVNIVCKDQSLTNNLGNSIYFSIITITTLGYGDYCPENSLAKLFVSIESILGIIIVGLYLNSWANLKSEQNITKHALLRFSGYNNLILKDIDCLKSYIALKPGNIPDDETLATAKKQEFCDISELHSKKTDELEPVIANYAKCLRELLNHLNDALASGSLSYWPQLEEMCVKFIDYHKEMSFLQEIETNNEKTITKIKRLINENQDMDSKRIDKSICSYIKLFKSRKVIIDFIENFNDISLN